MTTHLDPLLHDASVLRLVQIAVSEDLGSGDVTSEAIIEPSWMARATLVAKQAGVICGLPVAALVFRTVDPDVAWEPLVEEGAQVEGHTPIAYVYGAARSLLAAERTALNFLQRMSGVATLTRQYVEAVAGTTARILDTRKTIPAWRLLDKYACRIGGAHNHRIGLFDMVLIKDNHIAAAGSIEAAIEAVRPLWEEGTVRIEIEVQSTEQLKRALAVGNFHRIMLDNFPLDLLRQAVEMVAGRYETEASGGVTLATVRAIAETGVDFISVGALTHSAPALDISMDIAIARR
ncbi:MAG: carboxylating nicotinate-nucleotide diphosphorylase [Bacteroidota bacterium]|nr:carboxylating nicotinate-nucleotide diphosphorylase [Candidatus Kapabacteria bacterium]MCX7936932.1 carboxylating nicotinate-nucleotide diphosphorylase [Chlorobiota bacterium]MDW8271901.1 carboxylating nicotinate-nucleotide diphosphorylase [Bacteroidota bacterium]